MYAPVKFLPEGKIVKISRGSSILEAALKGNIDIASLCGGKGECGKCQIIIINGIEKTNSLSEAERAKFSPKKIKMGYRLACKTKVYGDVVVLIPDESRAGRQKLVKVGFEPEIRLDPAIRKVYLRLSEPNFSDLRADDRRVLEALRKKYFQQLDFEYEVIRKLPVTLRIGKWKIAVVIWSQKRIIDIEPGNWGNGLYGIAVDVGTTKVAVYLVDLKTGKILKSMSEMNPQIPYGEDVISRIVYAKKEKENLHFLQKEIIGCINRLICECCKEAKINPKHIYEMVVVGNTAMHHLFLGVEPEYVAKSPYIPGVAELINMKASNLKINMNPTGNVCVLPNVAGFVGADAVGDILASEIYKEKGLCLLIDVGTNTEIILGNRRRLFACSTASGPAFEGAHVRFGMRAATGAIEHIQIDSNSLSVSYKTVGGGKPRGVCGSGIIDAISEMLKAGIINVSGRIQKNLETTRIRKGDEGYEFMLVRKSETADGKEDIVITQNDIREIQKAKAAIHAGYTLLLREMKASEKDIKKVFVAGAFGLYINPLSARTIGMFPELPIETFYFIGNAAGSGAILALKSIKIREKSKKLARKIKYVELASKPEFQKEWLKSLYIPHARLNLYPKTKKLLNLQVGSEVFVLNEIL